MHDKVEDAVSNSPYILAAGRDLLHLEQFFIICEEEKVVEVSSFRRALVAILANYYVFDISYPTEAMNTFLFLQKKIFGLLSFQKFSASAVAAISCIEKL